METLKNLVVAMINATLILVALCLFLALKLTNTTERVVGAFASELQVLEPLTQSIQQLSTEVSDFRDLAEQRKANPSFEDLTAAQQTQTRLAAIQTRLDDLQATLDQIASTPDRLMNTAITTGADKAANVLADLQGCQKPDA